MSRVDPFREFISAIRAMVSKEMEEDRARADGRHEDADAAAVDRVDLSDAAAEKLRALIDAQISEAIDYHETWSHRS